VSEPLEKSPPRRPVYLVIALIAMWLVGLNTAAEGLFTIQIVRDPFVRGVQAIGVDSEALLRTAWVEATAANAQVSLPLGVAQLLLGSILVLISARALFSGRASMGFALQVLAANALLLLVGYILRQPIRAGVVDAVVASGIEPRPAGLSARELESMLRAKLWWTFRAILGLQVGVLALAGVALTRRSAREVLAPAEPTGEGS
jgi:hypothetical protein